MDSLIKTRIQDGIDIKKTLLEDDNLLEKISSLADVVTETIKNGHKLVLCGNGGSASDSLHFAGEIVGRFQKERSAWPAIALNADVATMTAIANDHGYDDVFARQAEGYVNAGDLFIGVSTSGNSENVYRAAHVAKNKGAMTVALLGKDGGKIGKQVDIPVIVPCQVTARVQECHIMIIHIICEILENRLNEA